MDISSLKARQGAVEVSGEIIAVSPPRSVKTPAGETQVSSAKLKDPTGVITISLWNEQVGKLSIGDLVKITNGYVGEFRGELQLSTGKFGTLEVMEKQKGLAASIPPQTAQTSQEKAPPKEELDDAKDVVITKQSSTVPAKGDAEAEEAGADDEPGSGDPDLPEYEVAKPVPHSQQTRPPDIDYPDVEEDIVKD